MKTLTKESCPAWGATWLLPDEYEVAWGARAIADTFVSGHGIRKARENKTYGSHIASLLPDRQSVKGSEDKWMGLKKWIDSKILPITLYYDGSSYQVTEVNDGEFHARWTPNGSYGYVYIIAWKD